MVKGCSGTTSRKPYTPIEECDEEYAFIESVLSLGAFMLTKYVAVKRPKSGDEK
jgi:hypothetical protein